MHKRYYLAVIIAFSMFLFIGCQSDTATEVNESAADSNLTDSGFPIVKEPIDLTFFTGKPPNTGNSYEDTLVWETYRELTDINVEFQLIPFSALEERRNLSLASGDYPDAFHTARLSTNDLIRYGEQGVLIPLNDLIKEHAPNFQKNSRGKSRSRKRADHARWKYLLPSKIL